MMSQSLKETFDVVFGLKIYLLYRSGVKFTVTKEEHFANLLENEARSSFIEMKHFIRNSVRRCIFI